MRVQFIGAAETVTGSKYLLESDSGQKILIDCGLFQGTKNNRDKNWQSLPVDPLEITDIVLTHAHIDHSGYIPKLVSDGFRGFIHCTHATKALAEILLYDSAYLKEEEAYYANKFGFSKHKPALPLYTQQDVEASLKLFRTHNFKEEFRIGDFSFKLYYAGHILGASSVLIECDGKKIYFSGDLGRQNDLIMYDPHAPAVADYWVVESTYGDRLHRQADPIDSIKQVLTRVKNNNSVLLIPSFAVGRAQTILYCISEVFNSNPDLRIPVYMNSPMASKITNIYLNLKNEHKLCEDDCRKIFDFVKFIDTPEQSKELNKQKGPMIIISASGMLTGGRILHHLEAFASDPNNIIMFVGFQAAATRGARILHGEKQIKFHGSYHEINAEVLNMDFFSAHADQNEILNWLKSTNDKPTVIFLTHGEAEAADTLRLKIKDELGVNTLVPRENSIFELR
jgi:metallo-beta-lactamase family protein